MNDYKKIMRVHESEDKDIRSLVTVVETDYMLQHLLGPIKKKNVRPNWKEANQTRGLIIYDSMRKLNSVIVS